MQQRRNRGAAEAWRCNRGETDGATEVQQKCNRSATEVQQRCNRGATEVQQRCNNCTGATEAQQRCNRGATAVQQQCNSGGASKSATRAELRLLLRRRRRRGWWRVGGGGGQMSSKHDAQIARMEEVGRARGGRVKTTRVETGGGRPQVPRPSRRRPRRNSAHELPPSPRPAAAPPLPSAVGRHGPGGGSREAVLSGAEARTPAAGNSAPGPAARGGLRGGIRGWLTSGPGGSG